MKATRICYDTAPLRLADGVGQSNSTSKSKLSEKHALEEEGCSERIFIKLEKETCFGKGGMLQREFSSVLNKKSHAAE